MTGFSRMRMRACLAGGVLCAAAAAAQQVEVKLTLAYNGFVVGEPVLVEVELLNATRNPVDLTGAVLTDALRVGKKVIVGFPNFAHYAARLQLFFGGRTPMTKDLPYQWHETPNLHFLSTTDFVDYCRSQEITILGSVYVGKKRRVMFLPNLFAQTAVFVITKTN